MALFDDDKLYSEQPRESGLFTPPSSGIGIAGDARDRAIAQMSPMQKVFGAMGDIGAALQGRPSPLDVRLKQQREERILQQKELKMNLEAMDDGMKMMERLQPEDREAFATSFAAQLEKNTPELGKAFMLASKRPDLMKQLGKVGEDEEVKLAYQVGGGEAVRKLFSSSDFYTRLEKRTDIKRLPIISEKVRIIAQNWQQLVPPEMVEKFNKDGVFSESEVRMANDYIREKYPKLALDDADLQALGRNSDAVFQPLGIATAKTEQEILKERGKVDARDKAPTTRTITQGGSEVQQEWRNGEWVEVGRGPKFKPSEGDERLQPTTISVNGKNIAALVDKRGNYYDANTRQPIVGGIGPQITEADERRQRELEGRSSAVVALENDVNALEKIAKEHPRSAAGLFSAPIRGIEYLSGSLNPAGTGSSPGTTAVQLRDAILQRTGSLSRMSNEDRKRLENALQVGTGGNPKNLPLAIKLLRDNIAKEKSEVGAPRARPQAGKKDYTRMTNEELLEALGSGR